MMRKRGFTIIEILMVVVIIGLVAAFAVPRLNVNAYRVNGAVRNVASLVLRAQRLAVTNQFNVNFIVDVDGAAIVLHEDANNDNVQDADERVRRYPIGENVLFGLGGAPERVYVPAPVTFTRQQSGMPVVIFRRDGSASENGGIYLTTPNAEAAGRLADARVVEITRATGRAAWYRYTGSIWERKF